MATKATQRQFHHTLLEVLLLTMITAILDTTFPIWVM